MGTGIIDMITRKNAGVPEPDIKINGGFFILTLRRTVKETKTTGKGDTIGGQESTQDGGLDGKTVPFACIKRSNIQKNS